jgi:RNase adapter protein RapZ
MPRTTPQSPAPPHFLIITGLSGSGKHSAVNTFEDLGYFCVDNLPVKLLPTFAAMCQRSGENLERAAVVLDAREPSFVEELPKVFDELRDLDLRVQLMFFEATDEVLMRRYSETRRPHPMAALSRKKLNLRDAVVAERTLLQPIRDLADIVVDTSGHTVHTLRQSLVNALSATGKKSPMQVTVMSFGFKHGIPSEADLVLDVRFLKNPHYVPALRPQTGRDKGVIEFLSAEAEVHETRKHFEDLLAFVVPRYAREGRSYLTVSVGCTGGRHRSVFMAENLTRFLKKKGFATVVRHRDIGK